MDALGLAPLTEALSAFGGWPMVDPSWSESSYSTEQSLALIRDLNFGPALGMAIESDLFDTSIKRLYVSVNSNHFMSSWSLIYYWNQYVTLSCGIEMFFNKVCNYYLRYENHLLCWTFGLWIDGDLIDKGCQLIVKQDRENEHKK